MSSCGHISASEITDNCYSREFCYRRWITELKWEIALGFYLVPTLYYGMVVLRNPFPQSEASKSGVSYGQMLALLASPILLLLFVLHACVGYVELGTDSWIQKITDAMVALANEASTRKEAELMEV